MQNTQTRKMKSAGKGWWDTESQSPYALLCPLEVVPGTSTLGKYPAGNCFSNKVRIYEHQAVLCGGPSLGELLCQGILSLRFTPEMLHR